MQTQTKKWGNRATVKMPLPVLAASQLSLKRTADIRQEHGHAITKPAAPDELQTLIAAITPENLHGEVSFGAPVGNEMF